MQTERNSTQLVMDVTEARSFAAKPKQPVATVQQQVVETDQRKIAHISKGHEAGFSLSQSGGSKAPNNKGLYDKPIANTSDDDFTTLIEKTKRSNLCEIMGD